MNPTPATPRPSAALLTVLPDLERLLEQTRTTLGPAMNQSRKARDAHGYTEAMRTLLKGMFFMVEATRAGHVGDVAAVHGALREADDVAQAATAAGRMAPAPCWGIWRTPKSRRSPRSS
ncbi:hypothetical protein [Streptosporangium jomthongense]|uniref:Uncharacterized protein n=1 Tax=Streptosporangium jomthongense TaxID=1193683 RepID=A0ABV8FFH3_9ACTN